MSEHTVVQFKGRESEVEDALTEVLHRGARKLLAEAVESEVECFIAEHRELRDERGRQAIVRNGYLPEREVQTGIGAVAVKVPRVRDRSGSGIRFHSVLLPPYLRRTKSLEELIPWLYLKGVSSGDMAEALQALLGPEAPGLSAGTVSRLKASWKEDLERWQSRDLQGRRYVYWWVDGIHLEARLEESKQCLLVVIGADETGRKELVGLWDGYRESTQSWQELLLDLKRRGLAIGAKLAIGDGALGFWAALAQIYGETRCQRDWVHKTANVLNKLPNGVQRQAKQRLHEIWMAPDKVSAEKALEYFVEAYAAKYPKAVECLDKDRDVLLTFYDFPAEHWCHIRTSNPVESTFATVRLRTAKTRGCLSRETALTMVFRLCLSAQKRWRRLNGPEYLAEVIEGIEFKDGVRITREAA